MISSKVQSDWIKGNYVKEFSLRILELLLAHCKIQKITEPQKISKIVKDLQDTVCVIYTVNLIL